MKKVLAVVLVALLTLSVGVGAIAAEPTELTFWTFQQFHIKLMEEGAVAWNALHPDQQVVIKSEVYPFDDMHNKALIALQSGVGAPDYIDIEMRKFPNFLKGQIQLVELNDIIEPEMDNFIKARLELYAKDGKYYGTPYHVGATVMYYNTEILDAAGVNADDIDTWADFVAAGKQVLEKTGKPMMTIEGNDVFTHWPLISQRGSDFLDADGNPIVDDEVNISALQFQHELIFKEKIAVVAPGGFHHHEEHYGFLNQGGAAAIMMPMWYMGRFVEFMPDLKGKIIVRPMPRWEEGGFRSAGMGGTGTVVTNQSKDIELAKGVLAQAKLTQEANIRIWNLLGFDPPRWDVWPMLKDQPSNDFTEYFGNYLFDMLMEVKDEINVVHAGELLPMAADTFRINTANYVLVQNSMSAEEALKELAEELRNQ